jgi:hypothetical protein
MSLNNVFSNLFPAGGLSGFASPTISADKTQASGAGVKGSSTVTVYKNGISAGTANANTAGAWSFSFGSALAAGDIVTYDAVLTGPPITVPGTPPVLATIGLLTDYALDKYALYFTPFGAQGTSLKNPGDYDANWTVDASTFPSNVKLGWKFPNGVLPNPQTGVWGYGFLAFGNYSQNSPLVQTTPRQVCEITSLTENVAWTYTGSTEFDFLCEMFLTKSAIQTGPSGAPVGIREIGFFLWPGADPSFGHYGTLLGYHTNGGVTWEVRDHSPYITFAPAGDVMVPTITIDWKAALLFLTYVGAISGSEWVNGVSAGVEPMANASTAGGTKSGTATISMNASMVGTALANMTYLGNGVLPTGGNDGSGSAAWLPQASNLAPGATDKEGGTTATTLRETSNGALQNHGYYLPQDRLVNLPSRKCDLSLMMDVKADQGRTKCEFSLYSSDFANQITPTFDLAALTTGAGTSNNTGLVLIYSQVIDLGGGWLRLISHFTKAAGITAMFASLLLRDSTGTDNYIGDTTKGITLRNRNRLIVHGPLSISGTAGQAQTVVGGGEPVQFAPNKTLPAGVTMNANTGAIDTSAATAAQGAYTGYRAIAGDPYGQIQQTDLFTITIGSTGGFTYPSGAEYQTLNFSGYATTEFTPALNSQTSPGNAQDAVRLTESTTASAQHKFSRDNAGTLTQGTKTVTVWARRSSGTRNMRLQIFGGGDYSSGLIVDVNTSSTPSIIASSASGRFAVSTASATLVGGYVKLVFTLTVSTGASLPIHPYFYTLGASNALAYTGDGASGLDLWGFDIR